MKDGFLIINKPQEMTSFDVVAILRKKLGLKRIGHLGTLDPMATGVLPVAIGKAAKVMEYLESDIKEYLAEFTFGLTSDTEDIWGEILSEKDASFVDEEAINKALCSFRGVIEQTPPIYSALKVDGRKLYEYARKGEAVDIKARKVYIEAFDFLGFGEDSAESEAGKAQHKVGLFRIRCSKGTYIRSLARDMGDKLGCGALMSGLTRTVVGDFKLSEAITIDEIRSMELDEIEESILPTDSALMRFPEVQLGDWEAKLFSNGVPLRGNQWKVSDSNTFRQPDIAHNSFDEFPLELPDDYSKLYRVYIRKDKSDREGSAPQRDTKVQASSADEFLGMGIALAGGGLKAHKVFAER